MRVCYKTGSLHDAQKTQMQRYRPVLPSSGYCFARYSGPPIGFLFFVFFTMPQPAQATDVFHIHLKTLNHLISECKKDLNQDEMKKILLEMITNQNLVVLYLLRVSS